MEVAIDIQDRMTTKDDSANVERLRGRLLSAESKPADYKGATVVGHRLISALITLNVAGFLACVALIATAISKEDTVITAQVVSSVLVSIRLFVIGAALPIVAWGIAALEFDRSHTKKKWLASMAMYILAVASLILFCIAGWRLPRAFLHSLQIIIDLGEGP